MTVSPFIESLDKQFRVLLSNLNGSSGGRQEAWQSFTTIGLPTRKSEEWKYTHIIPHLKDDIRPRLLKEDAPFIGRGIIADLQEAAFFVVNGYSRFDDTDVLRSINKVQPQVPVNYFSDPFVELNRAFATDGVAINVASNQAVEDVLYVPFITTGTGKRTLDSYRNQIEVGDNASVKIILHQVHQDATAENMTNIVTTIRVGENSSAELYLIENLRSEAIQLHHLEATLGRSSKLSTHTVSWGSKLGRNAINVVLKGEGCEAHLFGLYNINGSHHLDNHTLVDHAVPNCMSNELYKGILDGKATSVFNGKIIVRPDAQKTNAFQSNPNILLSNDATINSKPQLEIFADDVKCTHGATVGHLDEDSLFYLRSRGLGEDDARHMLIQAFAEEVIEKISVEPLREHLSNQLDTELQIP